MAKGKTGNAAAGGSLPRGRRVKANIQIQAQAQEDEGQPQAQRAQAQSSDNDLIPAGSKWSVDKTKQAIADGFFNLPQKASPGIQAIVNNGTMSKKRFDAAAQQARDMSLSPDDYYNSTLVYQKFVVAQKFENKPTVVNTAAFDKAKGRVIYRTVDQAETMSSSAIMKKTMYDDKSGVGMGIYGHGFYFSDVKRGSQSYGTEGHSTTCRAKIHPQARSIDYKSLYNMGQKAGISNIKDNDMISMFALSKGYQVITRTFDDGETYYNVLDRSVLLIDHKTEKY